VRLGDGVELGLRLRKRYIESLLAEAQTFEQELQSERRFADAGITVDQVEPVSGKAAVKDVVQTGNPGRASLVVTRHGFVRCSGERASRASDAPPRQSYQLCHCGKPSEIRW